MSIFLVAPTLNCNASCRHCSVSFSNKETVATCQTVVNSVMQCANYSRQKQGELIFHGGEPLLLGAEYYENIIEELNKRGFELSVFFQTNLLLYNQNWKIFFKKYRVRVSSSYDFFTNFRCLPMDGTGKYFQTWIEKVKQYQDDFGERLYVIVVMSKMNKPYVEDIIDIGGFLGLNLKLNPLFCAGRASLSFDHISLTAQDYGEILVRAYRQWLKYKSSGMVFEQGKVYEDYIRGVDIKPLTQCPYSGDCTGYIWGISPEGKIYNCLTSMYFGKYLLGDYITGINKQSFRRAQVDSLPNAECLLCGICHGGCKLFRTEDGKYFWCQSYKMLYNEVSIRI